MPAIVQVRNTLGDGLHLVVTLAAAPEGTPTFYASRLPGLAGSTGTEVIAQSGSGTAWTLQVRATATKVREAYYVTVEDDDGLADEDCEWLCYGSNLDLRNQIESALHELVADHRLAIERSLQIFMGDTEWPNGRPAVLTKVLKGYPVVTGQGGGLPVVSVRIHDIAEDLWFGVPYTDTMPIKGTIYAYAFHQGQGLPLEPVIAALGMGVFNVVNQLQNLNIPLDCGLICKAAHCSDLHTDEEFLGNPAGYMSIAEMNWQCEVAIGKDGE